MEDGNEFVGGLALSKARLSRSRRRKTSIRDTKVEESVEDQVTSSDIVKEEMDVGLPVKHESKTQTRLPSESEINKVTKQESGETASKTEDHDPQQNHEISPMVAVYIHIDHATPLKAKVLTTPMSVRVTFLNQISGQPLRKSSHQVSAVSYYENENPQVDYIMPIMTNIGKITCDRRGQFRAEWNEDLVFCEQKDHLLESEHVTVLIELLLLPHNTSPYCIAWGIILPTKISIGIDLPVQLYHVPRFWRADKNSIDLIETRRPRYYPTVLYMNITIKDITSLPNEPSLRSVIPTVPESSQIKTDEYLHLQRNKLKGSQGSLSTIGGDAPRWSRLPGQSCAVPDKLLTTLSTGTEGCSCLSFSSSGRFLAAACVDREEFSIKIYEVITWKLVCSLPCGVGLIHECNWSHDDLCIACASASGLCHVWILAEQVTEHVLPHPAYVYSVQWIGNSSVVVTACYDGAIRCWMNEKLIQVLMGSSGSRINTLCYEYNTNKLYSGDATGCITVWIVDNILDQISLQQDREFHISEIKDCSVQQLILFTGQQRLLVHALNKPYYILDLRLGIVNTILNVLQPSTIPCAVCLTPCGGLVLASNSQGVLTIWDTDTGKVVFENILPHLKTRVSSIRYHPYDHIAACSGVGPNQKLVILTGISTVKNHVKR